MHGLIWAALAAAVVLISWLGGRVIEADAAMRRAANESDERRETWG